MPVQYVKNKDYGNIFVVFHFWNEYTSQIKEILVLVQGSQGLKSTWNIEGFLEKSLKIKYALKSTGKSLKKL